MVYVNLCVRLLLSCTHIILTFGLGVCAHAVLPEVYYLWINLVWGSAVTMSVALLLAPFGADEVQRNRRSAQVDRDGGRLHRSAAARLVLRPAYRLLVDFYFETQGPRLKPSARHWQHLRDARPRLHERPRRLF